MEIQKSNTPRYFILCQVEMSYNLAVVNKIVSHFHVCQQKKTRNICELTIFILQQRTAHNNDLVLLLIHFHTMHGETILDRFRS